MKRTAHVATSAQLAAAHPFYAQTKAEHGGSYIGSDLLGGPFGYDPFELYRSGLLTNPNMVIMGQIGKGKSALVKSLLWRQAAKGRQVWVIDPKGEYDSLSRLWGVEPIHVRPGKIAPFNPLASLVQGDTVSCCSVLSAVLESVMHRRLIPSEKAALDTALQSMICERLSPSLTLNDVSEALLQPSDLVPPDAAMSKGELVSAGRDMALELRRLLKGELAGLFEGPVKRPFQADGLRTSTDPADHETMPIVVINMSALYGSEALGVVMICAVAWLRSLIHSSTNRQRILVVDEAWAILSDIAIARWFQASWKLSRAWGLANIAIVHRVADLAAAGAQGSESSQLAQGLLADSETRVLFGQPPSEAANCAAACGLSPAETDAIQRLGRGVALWKIAGRSHLVRHHLSPQESQMVDTDAALLEPR